MKMDKNEVIRASLKYNSYVMNTHEMDPTKRYELYATGDADLNGRKYIALPSKPTPEEIKKYNILR
jgi:hypothetical protein